MDHVIPYYSEFNISLTFQLNDKKLMWSTIEVVEDGLSEKVVPSEGNEVYKRV